MKTKLIFAGVVLLLGVVIWQRQSIATLRDEATRLSATAPATGQPEVGVPRPASELVSENATVSPSGSVSEERMQRALADFQQLAAEKRRLGSRGELRDVVLEKFGTLMDAIEAMSPEQLAVLYEQARKDGENPEPGVAAFAAFGGINLLEAANPQGMLQVYLRDPAGRVAAIRGPGLFGQWFRQDPAGLLRWAENWQGAAKGEAETTPGRNDFARQVTLWAGAAKLLKNPADPVVAEFAREMTRDAELQEESDDMVRLGLKKGESDARFKQKRWHFVGPIGALGASLNTFDARLEFLRGMHAATGGECYLAAFTTALVARVPFAQAAKLADAAPAFNPSGKSKLGMSFRLNVAMDSRDGAVAERWEWLTAREAVEGPVLKGLVDRWVMDDMKGTAAWVKSLAAGPIRDAAEAAYQQHVRK